MRQPPVKRRPLRWLLRGVALLVAVAVAVAVMVWVGGGALQARDELTAAATQAHIWQTQVVNGDRNAAAAALKSVQKHVDAARGDTHGAAWAAIRALPWLGPNVGAVQTMTEVIHDLAVRVLPSLADATSIIDPSTLTLVHGRIDLAQLRKAAPQVVTANAEVQSASQRLHAINPTTLLAAIAGPLADLRAQVDKVATATAAADHSIQLLP